MLLLTFILDTARKNNFGIFFSFSFLWRIHFWDSFSPLLCLFERPLFPSLPHIIFSFFFFTYATRGIELILRVVFIYTFALSLTVSIYLFYIFCPCLTFFPPPKPMYHYENRF